MGSLEVIVFFISPIFLVIVGGLILKVGASFFCKYKINFLRSATVFFLLWIGPKTYYLIAQTEKSDWDFYALLGVSHLNTFQALLWAFTIGAIVSSLYAGFCLLFVKTMNSKLSDVNLFAVISVILAFLAYLGCPIIVFQQWLAPQLFIFLYWLAHIVVLTALLLALNFSSETELAFLQQKKKIFEDDF